MLKYALLRSVATTAPPGSSMLFCLSAPITASALVWGGPNRKLRCAEHSVELLEDSVGHDNASVKAFGLIFPPGLRSGTSNPRTHRPATWVVMSPCTHIGIHPRNHPDPIWLPRSSRCGSSCSQMLQVPLPSCSLQRLSESCVAWCRLFHNQFSDLLLGLLISFSNSFSEFSSRLSCSRFLSFAQPLAPS